jgi:hypothetical protein
MSAIIVRAMENLAELLKDEEQLVERVEELYEDNVMLKVLNDPTSSRRDYSRPFWAEMHRFLPKATVQSLLKTLNVRRKMREESRKEALAMLQEVDVVPPKSQTKRKIEEYNAPVAARLTPLRRSRRQSTEMRSSESVTMIEANEMPRTKRSRRTIEDSDEILCNPSNSGDEMKGWASDDAPIEEEDQSETEQGLDIRNKVAPKQSAISDMRPMMRPKRRDDSSILQKPKASLRPKETATVSWESLSELCPDSEEFLPPLEHLFYRNVKCGTMSGPQFWRLLKIKIPNADVAELSQALKNRRRHPLVRKTADRSNCKEAVCQRQMTNVDQSLHIDAMELEGNSTSNFAFTNEDAFKTGSSAHVHVSNYRPCCDSASTQASPSNQGNASPSFSKEHMLAAQALMLIAKSTLDGFSEISLDSENLPVDRPCCVTTSTQNYLPNLANALPSSSKNKSPLDGLSEFSVDRSKRNAEDPNKLYTTDSNLLDETTEWPSVDLIEIEDTVLQTTQGLEMLNEVVPKPSWICHSLTAESEVSEEEDALRMTLPRQSEESPNLRTTRTELRTKKAATTFWKDLSNFSPVSWDFLLHLEGLYFDIVTSGNVNEVTFWSLLKSDFPDADIEKLTLKLKNRRQLQREGKSTQRSIQNSKLSWGDLSTFSSDSEEFLCRLENQYASNKKSGQYTAEEFWRLFRSDFPDLNSNALRYKINNRRGRRTKTELNRKKKELTQISKIPWGDLSAYSPDSKEFLHRLENICSSTVESGHCNAWEFWSLFRSDFPDVNSDALRDKMNRRRGYRTKKELNRKKKN